MSKKLRLPIKGFILLEETMPIAVFQNEKEASRAFWMYQEQNLGVLYTVLSADTHATGIAPLPDVPTPPKKKD